MGDGGGGLKGPVYFGGELGPRADGVPYRPYQRYRFVLLGSIKFIEDRAKRIELERSIPFLDHSFGSLVKFIGSAFDRVPAIGVRLDSITYRTTKQLIHRLTKSLSHNIPAGNLDGCDGRHCDLTGAGIVVPIHALHQILDIRRVVTKHVVRHRLRKIA